MTDFDVDRARRETRGCDRVAHFNNAGSALPPAPVQDLLYDYLREEEMSGGYETADRRRGELENFYRATARLLNADPSEIAFIENATRAWDMAFYALELGVGDRILTTVAEYGSNMIAYLHRARQTGCEVVVVPDDAAGQIDVEALERLIDDRVKLISISHIPTGGGLVNPAEAVGAVARRHGVPYLLDACQSAGQMPLDVEAIGCDFLSATGRKYLRGPRGTGFLYVRRGWIDRLDPPLLDQHAAELLSETEYRVRDDAKRFENWERYFAGQAALGAAVDYAMDWGLDAIRDRVFALADRLRAGLADIPGISVTDVGAVRCGIVTFTSAQESPRAIMARLAEAGIAVRTSSGSGSRVSFDRRGLDAVVRASVHYFNTDAEVDRMLGLLRR